MGLFDRWSQRGMPDIQYTDQEAVFLGSTYSGKQLTTTGSMRLVPVWAAVQFIAGSIGSLPLRVYRVQSDGQRVEAPDHRAAKLLARPNPIMSTDEFFETIASHLLLWGNAFILKNKNADGSLSELWPMPPSRIKVTRDNNGYPAYMVDGKDGPYGASTFLHIRGLSFDGMLGLSPVQYARQSLATYSAVEEHVGSFWKNNATPGGVLTHPSKLSADAAERLRAQWNSAHGGTKNASRTAILEEGMKFEPLSIPLEDAQMVATLELSTLQVARLFQIPAQMLQAKGGQDNLTYSTTETLGRQYVTYTLRRWLTRIEKSLLRDNDIFLSNGLGAQMTCSFDTTDLTRGDNTATVNNNIALLAAGVVTRDEVRADLGRSPYSPDVPDLVPDATPVDPLNDLGMPA